MNEINNKKELNHREDEKKKKITKAEKIIIKMNGK